MADFEDTFTEASDTLLKNHTPDVGTGWVFTGTDDDAWMVSGGNNWVTTTVTGAGTRGRGLDSISPDIGQADHQTWAERRLTQVGGVRVKGQTVRATDLENCFGQRYSGTGPTSLKLFKIEANTISALVESDGSVSNEWTRVKAEGDTISLWRADAGAEPTDPGQDTNWTQVGLDQTETFNNTETGCGLVVNVDDGTEFIYRTFRAHTVGAGGAATKTRQGGPILLAQRPSRHDLKRLRARIQRKH